jgi:hypothetical protein
MPECKKLRVVLVPTRSNEAFSKAKTFSINYQDANYTVCIRYLKWESITITAQENASCVQLWNVFILIHMVQALGVGYFYTIQSVIFQVPNRASQDELDSFAVYLKKNTLFIFHSADDWKGESLFLALPERLLNKDTVERFLLLYSDNAFRFIHNIAWVQCAHGVYPEMRCGGIIQLFENFSWYIKDSKRNKSHTDREWNIYKGLAYIFTEHSLEYFKENILDKSISIDKLIQTRNRMMHFDAWKNKGECICDGRENARYARILMIYYRFIVLRLINVDVEEQANNQIKEWHKMIFKMK